jgi:putative copper export protein
MKIRRSMTRGLPLLFAAPLLRSFHAAAGSTTSGVSGAAPIFQVIFTWLTLALATFWAGGCIFETWMVSPGDPDVDGDLRTVAEVAGRRFQSLAPYALVGLLVADIGLAMAVGAVMTGSGWARAVSPLTLKTILLGSRFGLAWWLRQVVILVALVVMAGPSHRTGSAPPVQTAEKATPDGNRDLPGALRGAARLPRQLIAGVRRRNLRERLLLLLSLLLLLTLALDGQATAGSLPSTSGAVYVVADNLLYLLSLAIWLGGLFYIGFVLLPASAVLRPHRRAGIMARGWPRFSELAIISVFVLGVTGLLNMTILPITWTEFLTTAYGRTLAVMMEIFVILVGMSVYHTYVLRPRLLLELTPAPQQPTLLPPADTAGERHPLMSVRQRQNLVGAAPIPHQIYASDVDEAGYGMGDHAGGSPGSTEPPQGGPGNQVAAGREELAPRARDLEERLRDWLRREALLGGALLLALTLLGIFGISLLPNLGAGSSSGHVTGPYVRTQSIKGYRVTMEVSPDVFGTNTFTVTLKDAKGDPVTGAGVMILTNSLDMDMGTQVLQLKEVGAKAPGSYSGQSELTMAGHWQVTVEIRLSHNATPLTTKFQFAAVY